MPSATDTDWWGYFLLFLTIAGWLERRLAASFYWFGIHTLRWGMAITFIWFGAIKLHTPPPVTFFFTQELAWLLPDGFPFLLGIWEMIIGVCFLHMDWMRYGIWQLKVHMPGTFLPLIILREEAFSVYPHVPALPALYILKNIVFVGAAFILWYEVMADKPFAKPPPKLTDPK